MSTDLPWNSRGLLSPISTPTGMNRSPYKISLVQLIERFATPPERRLIVNGFLAYRRELHKIGLADGFQWIDGSFVEDIEALETRPPGDIDVITFYAIPAGETQAKLFNKNPVLFPSNEDEKEALKKIFPVDGSLTSLDVTPRKLIKQTVFWYSLWAHRRDQTWKGFLEIELGGLDDAAAQSLLDSFHDMKTEMQDED